MNKTKTRLPAKVLLHPMVKMPFRCELPPIARGNPGRKTTVRLLVYHNIYV